MICEINFLTQRSVELIVKHCRHMATLAETESQITDLDLYGDLEVDVSQQLSYNEVKALCEKHESTVEELQKENKRLKEQNDVLKKNISSLYLTARNEILRKDAEIKRLQDLEVRNRKYGQRWQTSKGNGMT